MLSRLSPRRRCTRSLAKFINIHSRHALRARGRSRDTVQGCTHSCPHNPTPTPPPRSVGISNEGGTVDSYSYRLPESKKSNVAFSILSYNNLNHILKWSCSSCLQVASLRVRLLTNAFFYTVSKVSLAL